jgi:hypothetical protein
MGGIAPGQGIKNSAMATVGATDSGNRQPAEPVLPLLNQHTFVFVFCLEGDAR